MKRIDEFAAKELISLGMHANLIGYVYTIEAMRTFERVSKTGCVQEISQVSLFCEIASIHQTTTAGVERGFRHAIEVLFTKGDHERLEQIFGYSFNADSGRPSVQTFLHTFFVHCCIETENMRFLTPTRYRLKNRPIDEQMEEKRIVVYRTKRIRKSVDFSSSRWRYNS